MTQTATSKRGQGVVIHAQALHGDDGNWAIGKARVSLYIDGALASDDETMTATSARAKAAELTDDVGLIWETRP